MDIKECERVVVRKERPLNYHQFVISCRKHWYWFAVSAFLTTLFSLIFVLMAMPKYERSAEVMIKDDDTSRGVLNAGSLSMFSSLGLMNVTSNVNNELKVFQSVATMEKVVKRLGLMTGYFSLQWIGSRELTKDEMPVMVTFPGLKDDDKASCILQLKKDGSLSLSTFKRNKTKFEETVTGHVNELIKTPLGRIAIVKNAAFAKAFQGKDELKFKLVKYELYDVAERLGKHIKINLVDDQTSVIDLSYQDISAKRADEVLRTLISVYQQSWLADKNSSIDASTSFIDARIGSLEKQLSALDGNISKFKETHKIVDYDENAKAALSQIAMTDEALQKLNNELYVMKHMRNMMPKYGKLQLLPANLLPQNQSISSQIQDYNELILKRNTIEENSSGKNPIVESLDNQISSMRSAIGNSLEQGVEQLQIQTSKLSAKKGLSTSQMASVPSKIMQILPTERRQKVVEELYIYLLQKREENSISQIFGTKNLRIVTPPSGLQAPVFPRKGRTTAAGFLIGLVLPLIVLFVKESRNRRIRGLNGVEGADVSMVVALPWVKDGVVTVSKEGRDLNNDAFRNLRMQVVESAAQVVLLTAVTPQVGRSYVAINLAKALSLMGKRVALFDGDFRTQGLRSFLGLQNTRQKDFTEVGTTWKEALSSTSLLKPVDVISGDCLAQNPADFLSSESFKSIIQDLKDTYDYVVIDGPCQRYITDVALLEDVSELQLFVLRDGVSTVDDVEKIEHHAAETHTSPVGIIVNGTPSA